MQATDIKPKEQHLGKEDWLLSDLTYIHDYLIQEGCYADADDVEYAIKEAATSERRTRQLAGKKE